MQPGHTLFASRPRVCKPYALHPVLKQGVHSPMTAAGPSASVCVRRMYHPGHHCGNRHQSPRDAVSLAPGDLCGLLSWNSPSWAPPQHQPATATSSCTNQLHRCMCSNPLLLPLVPAPSAPHPPTGTHRCGWLWRRRACPMTASPLSCTTSRPGMRSWCPPPW
jgi:hypothetical protein